MLTQQRSHLRKTKTPSPFGCNVKNRERVEVEQMEKKRIKLFFEKGRKKPVNRITENNIQNSSLQGPTAPLKKIN